MMYENYSFIAISVTFAIHFTFRLVYLIYALFIFSGVPYNIFKADIWSLGVILFTMLTGHFPFADFKELVKMKDGVSFIGSKQDVSHEAVQLIRNMLHADPNSRLSIHEVCRHVWVKKSCV